VTDLRQYVLENQKVIQFVQDVTPGTLDRYIGTLDYATARFNTILIKLSQDPLLADQHKQEVKECFDTIQDFYSYTNKLITSNWLTAPFLRLILHIKGTLHIPKIKRLLERINN